MYYNAGDSAVYQEPFTDNSAHVTNFVHYEFEQFTELSGCKCPTKADIVIHTYTTTRFVILIRNMVYDKRIGIVIVVITN